MNFSNLIKHSPWQILLLGRLFLTKLHVNYNCCSSLGLTHFGNIDDAKYTYDVFMDHFQNFRRFSNCGKGFVSLELGPGDGLFSALITRTLGGSHSYLIDIDRFAKEDLKAYEQMAKYLGSRGLITPELSNCINLDDMLKICCGCYGTLGLKSLKMIPSRSVDFLFSTAVLEHVSKTEIYSTLKELYRICKKDCICSHTIDLKDHFHGSLNHLRLPESLWEATGMNRNFTNRLLYPDFLKLFKNAGFKILKIRKRCWETLPIPRERFVPPYSDYDEEDLRVASFTIVMRI